MEAIIGIVVFVLTCAVFLFIAVSKFNHQHENILLSKFPTDRWISLDEALALTGRHVMVVSDLETLVKKKLVEMRVSRELYGHLPSEELKHADNSVRFSRKEAGHFEYRAFKRYHGPRDSSAADENFFRSGGPFMPA